MERKVIRTALLATPLGDMRAGVVDGGVCLFEFAGERVGRALAELGRLLDAEVAEADDELFRLLREELDGYFKGALRRFTLPLVAPGTPFQEEAWRALRTIPYGETRTYGQQAGLLGKPKAVRAVGLANGRNRIAILIPCHRVVGADGSLTGYGGELWRKEWLLGLERRAGRLF